jgi:ABC-type sugar transport system ATPase subunit
MTSTPKTSEQAAQQSAPDFIEMRGISKRFGGVRALTDVSFSIRSGEIHCLAGENGCGKSTLIKILSGVHAPDEGEIVLEGKAHSHLSPAASQRFGVQIIYQDLSLFPNLSVAENIAFRHHVETPVRLANRQTMRNQAQAVTERLKVSLPLDALVGSLPIATRQLVAICRALAAQARLVVMDEPTASLTHQEVDALLETIHELKRQHIATVFVSHRLDEVMTIAERVTVLLGWRNLGPTGFGILIVVAWANSSQATSSRAASSRRSRATPLQCWRRVDSRARGSTRMSISHCAPVRSLALQGDWAPAAPNLRSRSSG